MLACLQSMAIASAEASNGVERPDTLLLPMRDWLLCSNTRLPDTNITVLSFFRENNPFITFVDWLPELTGGGPNSNNVYLAYRRDPTKISLEIPMEFRQLPPQEKGLEIVVPCESTCAGVLLYKPLSVAWAEVTDAAS